MVEAGTVIIIPLHLPTLLQLDILRQDMAAAALDSILFPLFGTQPTVEVRMNNGARSTSNPAYLSSVNMRQYNPISGSVGDTAETGGLTWPTTGAVTRVTA